MLVTDDRLQKLAAREIIPYSWLQDAAASDIIELSRMSDRQLRAARRMWPNDGAQLPTIPADEWLDDDGNAVNRI